MFTETVISR